MIYLDHAATTPLHPEARRAMEPFLTQQFGNPSSLHHAGQEARRALDDARDRLAAALGARAEEVIFTSGGTEANNLALTGTFLAERERRPHLITTATEHHSVLDTCRFLETLGAVVTVLPVGSDGLVDPEDVRRAITPRTSLISVMHANNEIGTIAPIAEIAAVAREAGVPLHTDAVQTVGSLKVDMGVLGVDLLSLSGHKFYGPKAAGALVRSRGDRQNNHSPRSRLRPLVYGGGQERGRRAGTENVAGIIGMVRALELALDEREAEAVRQAALRDRLIEGLCDAISDVVLNGHPMRRLPNNINLAFPPIEAEVLLLNLDLEGICASAGSACTAGSLEPSHVIQALGRSEEVTAGSIRLTLGRGTTEQEIDAVIERLAVIVSRLLSDSSVGSPKFRPDFEHQSPLTLTEARHDGR
jgi:cysteine desulfurase